MSSRPLQDMSWRTLQDMSSRRLQDVLQDVFKTSSRRFQGVLARRRQDVLELVILLGWRRFEDVVKTNQCFLGSSSNWYIYSNFCTITYSFFANSPFTTKSSLLVVFCEKGVHKFGKILKKTPALKTHF